MILSKMSRVYTALLLTAGFFGIWIMFNYPAFSESWWTRNDAEFLDIQNISLTTQLLLWLSKGLPLGFAFWVVPYRALAWLDPQQASFLMRIIQGLLHCLNATMIALLIHKVHPRSFSGVAVLVFLLWPFNGETTYWLAAMTYPLAAAISLFGLVFLVSEYELPWKKRATAFFLILSATLISRDASVVGAMVFIFLVGIDCVRGQWARWHQNYRIILLAYVCGGLLSFVISAKTTEILGFPETERTPIVAGLRSLFWIMRTFLIWPEFYPNMLAWFHVSLVILGIATALFLLWTSVQQGSRIRALLLMTGIIALLLLLPFIPQSLMGTFHFPWRTMYLSPLFFVFLYCLILLTKAPSQVSYSVFLSLLLIHISFFPFISIPNAEEYLHTYREDIAKLRNLESIASLHRVTTIIVANLPEWKPYENPYGLKYHFGDSKLSAFQIQWTSDPFIRVFSKTLHPSIDPTARNRCVDFCMSQRFIDYIILTTSSSLCYCP